jgi:GNAT superfamily N-acetyltransferase
MKYKMAVTTTVQGLGIGKILLEHCFAVAKEEC